MTFGFEVDIVKQYKVCKVAIIGQIKLPSIEVEGPVSVHKQSTHHQRAIGVEEVMRVLGNAICKTDNDVGA